MALSPIDYSRIAAEYASFRTVQPCVLRNLIDKVPVARNSRVLEVGCGTGNYIDAIRNLTGCVAVGIDPSEDMLSIAARKSPELILHAGKAESIDFPSNSFDLAFSVDVIHHVTDSMAYFHEAHRILKAGGKICTVTDSEWMIRNRTPQSLYFPETVPVELLRYPPIDLIDGQMKDAGFQNIREESAEFEYQVTTSEAYRAKVFSSLLLISDEAFERGLERMDADLSSGPIRGISRYAMIWGSKI